MHGLLPTLHSIMLIHGNMSINRIPRTAATGSRKISSDLLYPTYRTPGVNDAGGDNSFDLVVDLIYGLIVDLKHAGLQYLGILYTPLCR